MHSSALQSVSQLSHSRKRLVLSCSIVMTLIIGVALYHDLVQRVAYPPGRDQEDYLASGTAVVENFVFFWKAPLYSIWLGIFYMLSGKNLELCFYLEKTISILILAGLTGYLVKRLIDTRTGLLATIWVLNCKYLIIEQNNSHTLTAGLFTLGAISVISVESAARIPVLLLVLYLSTLVRSEMKLTLLVVVLFCLISAVRNMFRKSGGGPLLDKRSLTACVVCGVIAISLATLITLRPGSENMYPLIDEAFTQNFAANYVDRCRLADQYPRPWQSSRNIMRKVMPGANTMFDAITKYPSLVYEHILYNAKISIRGVPASVLGLDRLWLMAGAFVLYLASYLVWRREGSSLRGWESLSVDSKNLLIVMALSGSTLIVSTLLFRAAARYYIQLVPTLIPGILLFSYLIREKVRSRTRLNANNTI